MKKTKQTIIGPAVPNIPWEDRPTNSREVVWRYSRNPIIPQNAIPTSNSIFNSAVVPFKGKFAGVFRVDGIGSISDLHAGFSDDGINWNINETPIKWTGQIKQTPYEYGYDPRVVFVEDRWYVNWCTGISGDPTIGCAWTKDFKAFHIMENLTLPCNRNGVLFPRKINGRYAMLSRPSDPAHTPFGNVYYSESPDLKFWGCHRFVMPAKGMWQRHKIGPGPAPIETTEGWLLIYHGVHFTCSGLVYRAFAALLDLDEPWVVRYRTKGYILGPREYYERVGDVPNVLFPVAAITDAPTGRMAIYYGGADTVTGLAFTHVDELIHYIKKNSMV
jgi:beta-1,4-mannooligosaccharide/beta-1,4-mannosyl-N-acetylglucosamine phosphorylase